MTSIKKTLKSSWTPLHSEEANSKMFEERRLLVNKWFEKWTDEQRKKILEDLLLRSSRGQAEFAVEAVRARVPFARLDFTRELPRAICLYIFSFLDPRSLCRSAQVCWYWKFLAESDEVWMPKAARLGWFLTAEDMKSNTSDPLYASNLWKRFYLAKIHELQVQRPNMNSVTEDEKTAIEGTDRHPPHVRKVRKLAPWRGPDPKPVDTRRKNYLDDDDEEKMRRRSITTVTRPTSRGRSAKKLSNGRLHTSSEPRPLFDEEPQHPEPKTPPAPPAPPQELHPVPSLPRPGPTQRLVLRRKSPDRSERDLPSQDLFRTADASQAIPAAIPPAS